MNTIALPIFIGSFLLLIWTLLKQKVSLRWLGVLLVNAVVASVLLFVLYNFEWIKPYEIPINLVTLLTVTLLGIPGLILLFMIKILLL